MRYVYITEICPICGATLKKNQRYYESDYFGSPVRTCPKCFSKYLNNKYKEKALKERSVGIISTLQLLIYLGTFMFVLYSLLIWIFNIEFNTVVMWAFIVNGSISLTTYVNLTSIRIDFADEELFESLKRLTKPEYVKFLESIGQISGYNSVYSYYERNEISLNQFLIKKGDSNG